ncbi:MAG: adenylate kinase [Oscillospiraceae bacterium]|nr:adenylate kinase [Oscillospiraceae bacterium]
MILLISGASHTGKTALAQKLLERYHYPYLSIDHLKMGLIRSRQTTLTPTDDEKLTDYLWPIVKEMIKTVVENQQNLIVEGCYIPFDWDKDFSTDTLAQIRHIWLIFSESYIRTHWDDIKRYASVIERRMDDSDLSMEQLILENEEILRQCQRYGCRYILADESYTVDYTFEI